jgi:glyoxylase I family protein
MTTRVHHSAICVADVESSLRFYRDGMGLQQLMDESFDGEWRTLFGAPSDRLRSIMLGDPAHTDAGVVELVVFEQEAARPAPGAGAQQGFLLISFYVDVDATLQRLADLGFTGAARIEQPSPFGALPMATIRDPDGVMLELVDARIGQQVTG